MSATHIANSEAPKGWVNVFPQGAFDQNFVDNLRVAIDLLKGGTQVSKINDDLREDTIRINMRYFRTTIWLRDDCRVAIAFHTLDGPTNVPDRSPKILVSAGIDAHLGPEVVYPIDPRNVVYKSLRRAVRHFARKNSAVARLFLWVEGSNQPVLGDLIYPVFQCAINFDIAPGDSYIGVLEYYKQSIIAEFKEPRWCPNMRTWKLKTCGHHPRHAAALAATPGPPAAHSGAGPATVATTAGADQGSQS